MCAQDTHEPLPAAAASSVESCVEVLQGALVGKPLKTDRKSRNIHEAGSVAAAAAVAAALERDREALFRNTGLGKRQLQQQEVFAPSGYTRLKSSNSEVAESGNPQIATLCTDASGGQVISSRDWSLNTLYDCVGSPPNTLQVP